MRPPEEALAVARRDAREGVPDAFTGLSAPGLFAARASLARDVLGAEEGVPPAGDPRHAASVGLSDLPGWIALEAERSAAERPLPGLSSRYVAFARQARLEPLARAALLTAARLARTAAEKREARAAWDEWEPRSPGTERAAVAAALGRSRAAATAREATAALVGMLRAFPGGPESARDLFEPADLRLVSRTVDGAEPALRLLRARALAGRSPAAAADLAAPLARREGFRLEAAALLLAAGRGRAARDALTRPAPLAARDDAERRRIDALLVAADLRLLGEPPAGPTRRRPARRAAPRAPAAVPWAPRPPAPPEAVARFHTLAARAAAVPDGAVPAAERRLLLRETVRAALRLGLDAEAEAALSEVLASEPSTTLGAEELFRSVFVTTLSRRPAAYRAAAEAFQRHAGLWRDVAVRRRATYWAARSLAAAGRRAEARALWASLLSTAVPDLYARWAGQRLGVPVAAALPLEPGTLPSPFALRSDAPSLASRELLAAGLASIAEDAAEAERSADPIFLAACAADRFEFRRATAILKARWPELGTPDEGALPLAVRRAYYPFRQEALIVREAAASGVPAALVYGVIRQESLFQTEARSGAGATGLMQVMPATGRYLLRRENRRGRPDLKDPEVNVRLGARYLAMMLKQFDGDRIAALAGYNAGPGRPKRWKRLGPDLADDELLEAIPLSETRDYVKRVLFYEAAYAALHGAALDPLPLAGGPVSPRP